MLVLSVMQVFVHTESFIIFSYGIICTSLSSLQVLEKKPAHSYIIYVIAGHNSANTCTGIGC